ncbi:cobalt/nickel transport system ATP-binding protein [Halanaerobium saccharolyticum]|uniref:Cobalt/nickel transport system ATP-binding protein n=1 Tax=Halanaerobium saccharolyticum TaxID=43595 RepID=A0A4R7Z9Q6_9FIRM|nr:ABC transporter ATP-binding protein [Halanaerobium saccharolyticum]RAK10581.1 cobalt/nickel transport system ATP-binding protein [Halanaerobium saccharolyticum]TDW06662.1 cobalt/nickel transport system ATP-binding protein [Halanaerobium saccharolyticum]TDX62297.1 cobalt/nickel transport system ATP-binding protein [Halanaerobium saccharolyticum]
MIKVKNLSFSYDKEEYIFENFNFSLKNEERIALIGDNGCGKTTFFKLIMGLLKADSGQIEIFDQKREKEEDFIEVRERIGYLFQDSDNQLFLPTVEEDVAFGPINLGKSKAEAKKIVSEKLAMVKMEGFEKKVTYNLSQGQKKIIAFAAVLAMDPDVLLLDEPFASLDKQSIKRMIKILNKIAQPFIIVSHNNLLLDQVTNSSYFLE